MRIVVGIGNPGREYAGTRHNVGFDVVELLASRHGTSFRPGPNHGLEASFPYRGERVLLVKPLTYVNESGRCASRVLAFYKEGVPSLLVVVDDVNLPLAKLRFRAGGSSGGHKGLRSLIDHLHTEGFARLRVGVGAGDSHQDLRDHVLSRFGKEERQPIGAAVERAAEAVESWFTDPPDRIMGRYN
ncbi:MAG: aminoacyl-tRNA hydrolase [Planctomycetes bacterium]|nr:aminoacyl-tRNA hydrolase [Planctomycetota bacterium]